MDDIKKFIKIFGIREVIEKILLIVALFLY